MFPIKAIFLEGFLIDRNMGTVNPLVDKKFFIYLRLYVTKVG